MAYYMQGKFFAVEELNLTCAQNVQTSLKTFGSLKHITCESRGENTNIIINTGVNAHGQSCPFVQKLTPLERLQRPGVKSSFVLKL